MCSTVSVRIVVGVVIERRKAKSAWLDFLWRPVSVLVGKPSAAPWTRIGEKGEKTLFYAGEAAIELHRTETENYLQNLASGSPMLWVVLRPVAAEPAAPAFDILTVTPDPTEGEALTDAGNNLVETVSMPAEIIAATRKFILEHHVERPFNKRQRDRVDPMMRGRRERGRESSK
ncbi:DUF3305 domain-containing protein [Bradyrhizobium sp. Arg68]|uniref:DUF3305 domain-containing protein n=1 Tax=Bradyrhizobium ivorense TaxID=2511166 RepID=UPI0027E38BE8|nr:DUF3305 domain-containing protein [Bradyrhizobium ivorense]MCC8935400.1 DUF3305 domain-containing protein [Bradyrhizobium ivorense]